jgi:hypothetical protein
MGIVTLIVEVLGNIKPTDPLGLTNQEVSRKVWSEKNFITLFLPLIPEINDKNNVMDFSQMWYTREYISLSEDSTRGWGVYYNGKWRAKATTGIKEIGSGWSMYSWR